MRVFQTTAVVTEDGQLTTPAPSGMTSGKHRIVVIVEDVKQAVPSLYGEPSAEDDWPVPAHNPGPWPSGFSVSREEIYDEWGR